MALAFPKMFYKNSVKTVTGTEAVKNDLSLILQIEKGEQFGDPEFGVNLHKAKFKVNTSLASELAIDSVLGAQKFVGNVLFFRDDVRVKKTGTSEISIEIDAIFSHSSNKKDLLVIQGLEVE